MSFSSRFCVSLECVMSNAKTLVFMKNDIQINKKYNEEHFFEQSVKP